MKEQWDKLVAWLEARAPRERWLVLAMVAAAIVVLADTLAVNPLRNETQTARRAAQSLEQQVAALTDRLQALSARLAEDPNQALRAQVNALRQQHGQVDEQLQVLMVGLIQPIQMTEALRDMLAREKGLELVRLENRGTEAVQLTAAAAGGEAKPGAEGQAPARLFRHTMVLEVQGGYLDILRYLKRLEALDWTFYWEGLELNVVQYPKAQVRLTLYTLSVKEGWVGA